VTEITVSHLRGAVQHCHPNSRQQPQSPFRKIDGEEETAPGKEVATIVGHAVMLA
jgi:hypothetical protein